MSDEDDTQRITPTKVCPMCSAQAQTWQQFCPYCGGSYIRQPPPPPPPPPSRVAGPDWGKWVGISLALTAVFLGGLWYTGALDEQLADIGLNKEPCVQNLVTGATFCGDEARELCRRTEDIRRFANDPDDPCRELDY